MIYIDLENKLPTDSDLPGDIRWSQTNWKNWLDESAKLVQKIKELDDEARKNTGDAYKAKMKARNKFIDDNSAHWGKLKPWLLHLSHGKCWFTEAKDIASHAEVEHFRPKKQSIDKNGKVYDGYWWLAFDHTNFRIAFNVPNRKKGAWFPLRNDSPRSCFTKRCESDEIHYFLDPTNAYDVSLLAFDERGEAIPAPHIPRWEYIRVRRTVIRLKLTEHHALEEERRKVWQKVSIAINTYQSALSIVKHSPSARERAKSAAREIYELTKPTSELSSVARWCILLRNDTQLSKLMS